ncbi:MULTISPECIES: biliverdin-producing heme oxygenase [unclassified Acinetobacter]|uniref:biliverdin-producing heme oxygenase n=1 Tax=unclassified Acinetobacter TaxID=196816 RepID=UPI0035BAF47A
MNSIVNIENWTALQQLAFSEALKAHSRTTHDSVDHAVMSSEPFASVENYGKFLQVQNEFHQSLKPLYTAEDLNQQFNDLASLQRADRVEADMQALNVEPAKIDVARPQPTGAKRIGWLYCAEGSNVGAAILYKEAGKIELDENHGASHLATHPDGRMPHWRAFKAQLDALNLSDEEKQQALLGADDAFAYFKQVLRAVYQK